MTGGSPDVHDRLQRVFRSVFGDDLGELAPTATADDIRGWDSVAHISLMFAVEEEFGVEFTADQLAGFHNIGELEQFLQDAAS